MPESLTHIVVAHKGIVILALDATQLVEHHKQSITLKFEREIIGKLGTEQQRLAVMLWKTIHIVLTAQTRKLILETDELPVEQE